MQENEESQQRGESAPASATHAPGQRPRHERWLLASAVAATVSFIAAIGPGFAMATGDDHSIQRWVQPLPLPEPDAEIAASASEEAGAIAAEIPAAVEWRTVEIKPGQTMGAVFASLSLPGATLHRLLERPGLREPLTRVRAGARFDFRIDSAGELAGLRFERDETSIATVLIEGDTIREEITQRDIQHRVNLAHGTIEGSLVGAAGKVGIGYGTVLEMAKVFGYDIDFSQDLRVGDTFSVVYEEIYRDGERLRSGDILAASFMNQGKPYHAFRYTFADGRTEYFDLEVASGRLRQGRTGAPGRHHRLRRCQRTGHRSAPALRIPHQRRTPRSAQGDPAQARAAAAFGAGAIPGPNRPAACQTRAARGQTALCRQLTRRKAGSTLA